MNTYDQFRKKIVIIRNKCYLLWTGSKCLWPQLTIKPLCFACLKKLKPKSWL